MVYNVNINFALQKETLTLYKKIRDLREDSDLTQKEIAEILHLHKTTYTRYESGERELPLNVAIQLAKHYRVSLDYLAGLSNQKQA